MKAIRTGDFRQKTTCSSMSILYFPYLVIIPDIDFKMQKFDNY